MIYILFVYVTILFLVSLYIFNFEIMSPSVISMGMFTLSVGIAVLNVRNWDIQYSTKAFTLIATGLLTIVVTELLVKSLYGNRIAVEKVIQKESKVRQINKNISVLILLFCSIALIIYINNALRLANGSANIFGGSVFFRLNQFAKHSQKLELEGGIGAFYVQLGKLIQIFAYVYMFKLINNCIHGEKIKDNLDSIIMTFIYIILVMFQTTRTPLINLFIFSFLIFYIKNIQNKNWKYKSREGTKFLKKALLIVVVGMPTFFFFGENILGRKTGNTIWQYISAYVAGGVQHFNQYVIDPIEKNNHFGEECFAYVYQGLYKLGLTDYTRTIHLEYRWLSPSIHGNVYTFFRRPLQDFGVIGMYVFTAIVFFIFGYLYYSKVRNKAATLKNDELLFFIAYIYSAVVYVSIDSSAVANLLSIGNIFQYILMFFIFRFVFRIKLITK